MVLLKVMNKQLVIIGLSVLLGVAIYAMFAMGFRHSDALAELESIRRDLTTQLVVAEGRVEELRNRIDALADTNAELAEQNKELRRVAGEAGDDITGAIDRIDGIIERARRIASLFDEYERRVTEEINRLRESSRAVGEEGET